MPEFFKRSRPEDDDDDYSLEISGTTGDTDSLNELLQAIIKKSEGKIEIGSSMDMEKLSEMVESDDSAPAFIKELVKRYRDGDIVQAMTGRDSNYGGDVDADSFTEYVGKRLKKEKGSGIVNYKWLRGKDTVCDNQMCDRRGGIVLLEIDAEEIGKKIGIVAVNEHQQDFTISMIGTEEAKSMINTLMPMISDLENR